MQAHIHNKREESRSNYGVGSMSFVHTWQWCQHTTKDDCDEQ